LRELEFACATVIPPIAGKCPQTWPTLRTRNKPRLSDGGNIAPIALGDTSHFHITKGILDSPQRYWKHLLDDSEQPDADEGG
jgi:hypothetical protein